MSLLRSALLLSALALTLTACDADSCEIKGDGVATVNSTVVVDYVGTLASDGSQFDAGNCSEFPLGNVIAGFRDGIIGMSPGDQKTITVPPEQGYGNRPPPGIPAGATLIFDVRLLQIR